ncbi:hypothetical protein BDN72DRAFT_334048 [Pluteus cervinus]|uniref:Uncharacterized protein n=1 Tax=Pluteus cervinus TaxID=181527 RepID=A0ACD3B2S0_9AGAR|nr:hypothetical protein BDN72DRAFT_334048 [Pluteus cervinus]
MWSSASEVDEEWEGGKHETKECLKVERKKKIWELTLLISKGPYTGFMPPLLAISFISSLVAIAFSSTGVVASLFVERAMSNGMELDWGTGLNFCACGLSWGVVADSEGEDEDKATITRTFSFLPFREEKTSRNLVNIVAETNLLKFGGWLSHTGDVWRGGSTK